jgi:hypothetical protein
MRIQSNFLGLFFTLLVLKVLSAEPLALAGDLEDRLNSIEKKLDQVLERLDSNPTNPNQPSKWICSATCVGAYLSDPLITIDVDRVEAFVRIAKKCKESAPNPDLRVGTGYANIQNACFKE